MTRLLATLLVLAALPVAAAQARPVELGPGEHPTIGVDASGTAHVVWQAPSHLPDPTRLEYCRLPPGATKCAARLELPQLPGTSGGPHLWLRHDGSLVIIDTRCCDGYPGASSDPLAYNPGEDPTTEPEEAKRGGTDGDGDDTGGLGTFALISRDGGTTWTVRRSIAGLPFPIGDREFSSRDARLTPDGRNTVILGTLFTYCLSCTDIMQTAALDPSSPDALATGFSVPNVDGASGSNQVRSNQVRIATRIGFLRDGRTMILAGGNGEGGSSAAGVSPFLRPGAAMRIMDINGTLGPWQRLRPVDVGELVDGPGGVHLLEVGTGTRTGYSVSQFRGTTLGNPHRVSADTGANARHAMFEDPRGGLHVTYLSTRGFDGCAESEVKNGTPGECIVYRRASPGQPFGPKSTIFTTAANGPAVTEPALAADRAGEGWVTWTALKTGSSLAPTGVVAAPLAVTSQLDLGRGKTIRLVTPTECDNSRAARFTASIRTAGAAVRVQRVRYRSPLQMLPHRATQTRPPFSQGFHVDRSGTFPLIALVSYRVGGGRPQTVTLRQEMSFGCTG